MQLEIVDGDVMLVIAVGAFRKVTNRPALIVCVPSFSRPRDMVPSAAAVPTRQSEISLHQRLMEGDPVAPSLLAETYLNPLITWLTTKNRTIAADFIEEAAGEALISLIKNPQSFVPSRTLALTPLFSFLTLSAQRDLQNLLQREQRHRRGRVCLNDVELSLLARNDLGETNETASSLEVREEAAKANQDVLTRVREGLTEGELSALEMLLQGERKTAPYARALGIEHMTKTECKAAVKKTKDKLKKRIERERHGRTS